MLSPAGGAEGKGRVGKERKWGESVVLMEVAEMWPAPAEGEEGRGEGGCLLVEGRPPEA